MRGVRGKRELSLLHPPQLSSALPAHPTSLTSARSRRLMCISLRPLTSARSRRLMCISSWAYPFLRRWRKYSAVVLKEKKPKSNSLTCCNEGGWRGRG